MLVDVVLLIQAAGVLVLSVLVVVVDVTCALVKLVVGCGVSLVVVCTVVVGAVVAEPRVA